MKTSFLATYLVLLILLVSSFRWKEIPDDESLLRKQTGTASYYNDKHHGKKTASGEIYHNAKFTAAHRTLPFGTEVKVTNLSNGKSVTVRINDRGPYAKGRLIDISKIAAQEIGIIQMGIAKVSIEYQAQQAASGS
jgi:rare lipoprotein A